MEWNFPRFPRRHYFEISSASLAIFVRIYTEIIRRDLIYERILDETIFLKEFRS